MISVAVKQAVKKKVNYTIATKTKTKPNARPQYGHFLFGATPWLRPKPAGH